MTIKHQREGEEGKEEEEGEEEGGFVQRKRARIGSIFEGIVAAARRISTTRARVKLLEGISLEDGLKVWAV